jgi:hypothetical protein
MVLYNKAKPILEFQGLRLFMILWVYYNQSYDNNSIKYWAGLGSLASILQYLKKKSLGTIMSKF